MTAFYVYELADPWTGVAFYVGKGKGGRLHQHERDARGGMLGRRCDRIRDILKSGKSPVARVVKRFSDEREAFRYERELIAEYGIDTLTNICLGGHGGKQKPVDPVADALKVVGAHADKMRAFLRRAPGTRYVLGPYDLTDIISDLIDRHKELLGEARFERALVGL